MNCENVREYLSEFLDNEIDAGIRKKVEEHLAMCNSCKKEYEDLKNLCRMISSTASAELKEDLSEKIMKRIEADDIEFEPLTEVIKISKFSKFFKPITILSASAALFFIAFSIILISKYHLSEKIREPEVIFEKYKPEVPDFKVAEKIVGKGGITDGQTQTVEYFDEPTYNIADELSTNDTLVVYTDDFNSVVNNIKVFCIENRIKVYTYSVKLVEEESKAKYVDIHNKFEPESTIYFATQIPYDTNTFTSIVDNLKIEEDDLVEFTDSLSLVYSTAINSWLETQDLLSQPPILNIYRTALKDKEDSKAEQNLFDINDYNKQICELFNVQTGTSVIPIETKEGVSKDEKGKTQVFPQGKVEAGERQTIPQKYYTIIILNKEIQSKELKKVEKK